MILLKCAHDGGHPVLELQTNVPEDYAKISQSRAMTFKTLLRHYTKLALTLSR